MTNFEKYKTAQERSEGFYSFCEYKEMCDKCPLIHEHRRNINECRFAWLDLDAEEEPQESFEDLLKEVREFADSFIVNGEDKGLENPCDTLHEIADRFEAAHNRVAKKCMEVR